jgi:hypothetical protein
MIIDLDSWEEGYRDGIGSPFQCTPGLDRFSYSSGYFQACAHRKGTPEGLQPHYTRLSMQRRHGRSSRLVIMYCTVRAAPTLPPPPPVGGWVVAPDPVSKNKKKIRH